MRRVLVLFVTLPACDRIFTITELGPDPDGPSMMVDAAVDVGIETHDGGTPIELDASPCDGIATCATGPQTMQTNTHCFARCEDSVSQPTAEARCMIWGGHLASSEDAGEKQVLDALSNGASHWIGWVQDSVATNPDENWHFNDGGLPSGPGGFWATTEPNDVDGIENGAEQCAVLAPNVGWQDLPCVTLIPYLCKK